MTDTQLVFCLSQLPQALSHALVFVPSSYIIDGAFIGRVTENLEEWRNDVQVFAKKNAYTWTFLLRIFARRELAWRIDVTVFESLLQLGALVLP